MTERFPLENGKGDIVIDDDGLWIDNRCCGCNLYTEDTGILKKLRDAIGVFLVEKNRGDDQ